MRVRIRFGKGTKIGRKRPQRFRSIASGAGALLTPAAVATSVLGFWRVAADLKWTADFPIGTGFFSHWQVWFVGAALLQLAARGLHRYSTPVDLPEETDHGTIEPAHGRSRAL